MTSPLVRPPPIAIDRRSQVPLHRQIYDAWRRGILSGRFGPGDRLPSTRELSAALQVSRATVTAAYDQLAAEGYVDPRRGSGMFVSQELPERARWPARPVRASTPNAAVRLSGFVGRLGPVNSRRPIAAGAIDLSTTGPSTTSSRSRPGGA